MTWSQSSSRGRPKRSRHCCAVSSPQCQYSNSNVGLRTSSPDHSTPARDQRRPQVISIRVFIPVCVGGHEFGRLEHELRYRLSVSSDGFRDNTTPRSRSGAAVAISERRRRPRGLRGHPVQSSSASALPGSPAVEPSLAPSGESIRTKGGSFPAGPLVPTRQSEPRATSASQDGTCRTNRERSHQRPIGLRA